MEKPISLNFVNLSQPFSMSRIAGSCCAIGCYNKREKESTLSFYGIPNGDSEEGKITKKLFDCCDMSNGMDRGKNSARLCSIHFISSS